MNHIYQASTNSLSEICLDGNVIGALVRSGGVVSILMPSDFELENCPVKSYAIG